MKHCILAFLVFLSSCYTYPGKYCPDDIYFSTPRNNNIAASVMNYSPYYYPFYLHPFYRGYYYAPPRVNVYTPYLSPSPILPRQPRRVITSPDNKKTHQNNNKHNAPIRKF